MPSALLVGASGQVGRQVLKELLDSSHWTEVGEYGRKLTDLSDFITKHNLPSTAVNKVKQEKVDFDALLAEKDATGKETQKFKKQSWDVVLITLGTTSKDAGSNEMFKKIDKDFVVKAAEAALISPKEIHQLGDLQLWSMFRPLVLIRVLACFIPRPRARRRMYCQNLAIRTPSYYGRVFSREPKDRRGGLVKPLQDLSYNPFRSSPTALVSRLQIWPKVCFMPRKLGHQTFPKRWGQRNPQRRSRTQSLATQDR